MSKERTQKHNLSQLHLYCKITSTISYNVKLQRTLYSRIVDY